VPALVVRDADTPFQWVTVQTMQSLTWRRRYFHLVGPELRMYRSERDANSADTAAPPLVSVPLAGAQVCETYEDSQVKGSWRLRDPSGQVSRRSSQSN
jgi:hypothetical protein